MGLSASHHKGHNLALGSLFDDFNEIMLSFDVQGGLLPNKSALNFLRMLDDCELLNLVAGGSHFMLFRRMAHNVLKEV